MKNDSEKLSHIYGTVVFLHRNSGSKSEGLFPFLYLNKENCIKIRLQDDNPFENRKLLPYDGQMVDVYGIQKSSGLLLISEIKLVSSASSTEHDIKENNTETNE